MKDMEKKIKMELLQKLMDEMDDSSMTSFSVKKSEPLAVMEVGELGEEKMPKKKMSMEMPELEMAEEEGELEGYDEDSEEEDEPLGMSLMMQKLHEMKKKKKLAEV